MPPDPLAVAARPAGSAGGGRTASSLALACGPYQVGVPEHGRAYYRDAQGQALGVDVDLIATLARRVELMFSHPGGLKASKPPWLDEVSLQDWAPQDDVLVTLLVSTERIPAKDRQRLQQHFRAMRRDGTVDAILAKRLGEAFARQVRLPLDD